MMNRRRRDTLRLLGIPTDPGHQHFRALAAGDSGSGKSSAGNKLLAEVLGRGHAAVVLDVGGNMRAFVEAKAPPGTPIYDVGPYEQDGFAPGFAELLQYETDRQSAAAKLIPDVPGDPNPFFNKSARIVLKKILAIQHHYAPGLFTLGDVIRLARAMNIARVLGRLSGVGDPWRQFENDESRADVHATLVSALEPHAPAAALWDAAGRTVSIADFARRREGVLILPWTDRLAAALEGAYAFLMEWVADLMLEDLAPANDAWFFMDEFRQLAALSFVGNVARRGRKGGVLIYADIHESFGLRDRYGADRADEIIGMFNYLCVLRCGSPEAADWCSRRFGEPETLTDLPPRRTGLPQRAEGDYARSIAPRRNVPADLIRKARSVDVAGDRLRGWLDWPGPGGWAPFECPFLADTTAPPRGPRGRRPRSAETLPDLAMEDIDRLGFPNVTEVVEAI